MQPLSVEINKYHRFYVPSGGLEIREVKSRIRKLIGPGRDAVYEKGQLFFNWIVFENKQKKRFTVLVARETDYAALILVF